MNELEYYLYSMLEAIDNETQGIECFHDFKEHNPNIVAKYHKTLELCKLAEKNKLEVEEN